MRNTSDRPALQWALIPLLMNMPLYIVEQLNEVQRVELLLVLDFLYDEQQYPYKDMIGSFGNSIFGDTFYGPGNGLSHLTFEEFIAAETRLELYTKNPTEHADKLDEFCGILYRETSAQYKLLADKRIPFNEGLIPHYAQKIKETEPHIKDAIVLIFQGCKAQFPKLYRHLYPESLQKTEKKPTGVKPKSQALTWLNMVISMAERDVTKIDDIHKSPLHRALKVLDESIAYNNKVREDMRKQSKK